MEKEKIVGAWVRLNAEHQNGVHFFKKRTNARSEKMVLATLEQHPLCNDNIQLHHFSEILVDHSDQSQVNCNACRCLVLDQGGSGCPHPRATESNQKGKLLVNQPE